MEEDKIARYVRMIARKGSISSAATELGISQPTLSVALKKAERHLGFPLFDRSTTPLALTAAGRVYLGYADDVASLKRNLIRKVSDIEGLRRGELVIGGVGTFNLIHFPHAVALFTERYPGIDLRVVDGTAPEMARDALDGKIDVLVAPLMDNNEEFEYEELLCEKLFLCVPPQWNIVKHLPPIDARGYAPITKADFELLKNEQFITMHDDQVMGKKLKQLLNANGVVFNRTVQSSQMLTCLALTMNGVGISLVTESALQYAKPEVAPALYLPVEDLCTRVLYVARPKNHYVSAAAKAFIEILKETVSANNRPL